MEKRSIVQSKEDIENKILQNDLKMIAAQDIKL